MSNETHLTYDLSDVLGLEAAGNIQPGTTLLIAGPSMTGKESLTLDALASGLTNTEGAITVTTSDAGEDSIAAIESRMTTINHRHVGAIDCRADGGREDKELENGSYVYSVSEPSDFTGIGIGITNCFSKMDELELEQCRMAVNSLSMMVTYSDRETVFKFCHVLASRLDSAGYLGLFTMDTGVHEDRTIEVIKQAFDGMIEIRETDDGREARLRGVNPEPTEWTSL